MLDSSFNSSSLSKKFYLLGIVKSYQHSSNFLHRSLLQSSQVIIDRLPKDFVLIVDDTRFSTNKKIISCLSPLIHDNMEKDKNYNSYTFKKASAFSVFPLFCKLLKGEEVILENESLILLRKLLKELQINISSRSSFHFSNRLRRKYFDQNFLPKNNLYCISYSYDFFKLFEKKFIIKTRSYSYECYIPYVYVSDLLYRKIKENNENFTNDNHNIQADETYSYFYDVDDEESTYKKVLSIFSPFFNNNSELDYNLLSKIADDFEITFLPQFIQELIERRAFVDKKFLEYDLSESEKLMNRLFTFEVKDVDDMLEYLKNSK